MDRPSAIYESEKQLKALADVLEGKEYKNTGATRGQSKWLKYIAELTEKNQVFGPKMVETEIMPEQTFTFIDDNGKVFTQSLVTLNIDSIIPEKTYNVKFDGALYRIKCVNYRNYMFLGNLALIDDDPSHNTGEPFVIEFVSNGENSGILCITTLGVGDHTISISKNETIIKKIPKEYLPDNIGSGSSVQSDWNQTDATASDYIKNKPTITAQVQSDWNQTDTTAKDYIKNKPNISGQGEQVQADWNQTNTTAKDYIKNKPTIIGKTSVNQYGSALGEVFNNYSDNAANGFYSHAEGTKTTASGSGSHAEGTQTTASGDHSHAEGWSTKATNDSCHAEGSSTEATGYCSHAEGSNTKASEQYSHAEGTYTKAMGKYSHAEGGNTVALGQWSHAEGAYAEANGNRSHAEGWSTKANGEASHAEGLQTKASSKNQHAEGKYNIEDTAETYAHIVGNGTSDNSRSNAHTLDWSGNAWYAGTVEGTAMIVKSSTSGSSKRFKITVDDSGAITATEITA